MTLATKPFFLFGFYVRSCWEMSSLFIEDHVFHEFLKVCKRKATVAINELLCLKNVGAQISLFFTSYSPLCSVVPKRYHNGMDDEIFLCLTVRVMMTSFGP